MSRTKQETVSLNLRLPAELHSKLVEASEEETPARSLNSEILARLYASFGEWKGSHPNIAARRMQLEELTEPSEQEINDRVARLEQEVAELRGQIVQAGGDWRKK